MINGPQRYQSYHQLTYLIVQWLGSWIGGYLCLTQRCVAKEAARKTQLTTGEIKTMTNQEKLILSRVNTKKASKKAAYEALLDIIDRADLTSHHANMEQYATVLSFFQPVIKNAKTPWEFLAMMTDKGESYFDMHLVYVKSGKAYSSNGHYLAICDTDKTDGFYTKEGVQVKNNGLGYPDVDAIVQQTKTIQPCDINAAKPDRVKVDGKWVTNCYPGINLDKNYVDTWLKYADNTDMQLGADVDMAIGESKGVTFIVMGMME